MEFLDNIYTKNKPNIPIYSNKILSDKDKVLYICYLRCDELCPYLLYLEGIMFDNKECVNGKFIIFIGNVYINSDNDALLNDNISSNNITYLILSNSISGVTINNLQYYKNIYFQNYIPRVQYLVVNATAANIFKPYNITRYLKHVKIIYDHHHPRWDDCEYTYGGIEEILYPITKDVIINYDGCSYFKEMEHFIDG